MTEESIWIVTEAEPTQPDATSGVRSGTGTNPFSRSKEQAAQVVKPVKVSAQRLEAKMSDFLRVVGRVFQNAEKKAELTSGLCLDEIEVSVEITGEGEFKLMGTGAKAGAKGAMTLKFKRKAAGLTQID